MFGLQRSQPNLDERLTLLENLVMLNLPRVAALESRMNDVDNVIHALDERTNQIVQHDDHASLPSPAGARVQPEEMISRQYFDAARAASQGASAPAPAQAPTVASHRGQGAIVPGARRGFSSSQITPATSVTITAEMAEGAPLYTEDRNPAPQPAGAPGAPQARD